MLLPIPVRSVQQGLTQVARSGPDVAPSRIDGVWGPDTRESLAGYVELDPAGLLSLADQRDLVQRLRSPGTPYAPARAEVIVLPDTLTVELLRQASAYTRSLPAGVDVPQSMQNAERPRTVVSTNDGQPTVLVPSVQRSGGSPVLSIVLGLGAAAVLVGGGYWLMTR